MNFAKLLMVINLYLQKFFPDNHFFLLSPRPKHPNPYHNHQHCENSG
jgi:hypothetical protein